MSLRFAWCDVAVSLLLMAVAGWFLVESKELALESADVFIGPATFPTTIAILLILTSSFLFLQSVFKLYRHTPDTLVEFRRPVVVLTGGILVTMFVTFMDAAGFYPAAAVWLLSFGYVAGVRRPTQLGGLVVGFLAFAWIVFEKLLGTPLP